MNIGMSACGYRSPPIQPGGFFEMKVRLLISRPVSIAFYIHIKKWWFLPDRE
jgi:hypothetical protein